MAWNLRRATTPSGWQSLNIGGGGYVTGIDIHGNGRVTSDGSMVVRTDVCGAYHRNADETRWRPLCSKSTMGSTATLAAGDEFGCLEVAIAPSNPSVIYMLYFNCVTPTGYQIRMFKSTDRGLTFSMTDSSFSTDSRSSYFPFGGLANSNYVKFGTERILIDPYNENVVYVGTYPKPYLGLVGSCDGMYRTLDGGTTWSRVTGIPICGSIPGYCGMVADMSTGSTTLSGHTVCKRLIIPVAGQGVYESNDGGSTWSSISSNPTPAGTGSITTTQTNDVIIVHVTVPSAGVCNSITNTGTAVLTWNLRMVQNSQNIGMNLFEFWAKAPLAGTYNLSINYGDGCPGGFGTNNCSAHAFAVHGADITSESTIFDVTIGNGTSSSSQNLASASITTATNNAMVIISAFSNGTTVDTGYTRINANTSNWGYQAYGIEATAGAKTKTIASAYSYLIDAIKPSGSLTIDGTPVLITSAAASMTAPTFVSCGQVDYDGNYWCLTQLQWGATTGQIWRYLKGGSWESMAGSGVGSTCFAATGAGIQGAQVVVDPRNGHQGEVAVLTGAQFCVGSNTVNGTAAKGSINWGAQGSPSFVTRSGEPGWLKYMAPTSGAMRIHPGTGDYWGADGVKVFHCPGGVSWYQGAYTYQEIALTTGIEEMCAQDVIAGPGMPNPVVIAQDRAVIPTCMPGAPGTYAAPGTQTNGTQGDFCGTSPHYCFSMSHSGITSNLTQYSTDYGATWTPMEYTPTEIYSGTNCTGGACAVLSYTNSTTATIIAASLHAPSVQYTLTNGSTPWQNCSGLPSDCTWVFGAFGTQSRSRGIAARRDSTTIAWAYAYGGTAQGLYKTTDSGANWSRVSTFDLGTVQYGVNLINPIGYPDDLFLTGLYYATGNSSYINYCSNANAGSPTFSRIGTDISQIYVFGVGKLESGGTYPTLFVIGTHATLGFGIFKSKDKGTSWTSLGDFSSLPLVNQFDYPQTLVGDWERAGQFYLPFNSSGCAMYAP